MSNKARMIERVASGVTAKLVDEGKLVEAGFAAFADFVIAKDAPPIQREEMRLAFMAGADHLFSSIMNVLDPGDAEPTERDLRRMNSIHAELENWRGRISERMTPAQGPG